MYLFLYGRECVSVWLSMHLRLGIPAKSCALLHKPSEAIHLTVLAHRPARMHTYTYLGVESIYTYLLSQVLWGHLEDCWLP